FAQFFRCAQAFDRRDFAAFGFDGEQGTGINRVAVHQYRASAAGAPVADLLATGEIEPVAQRVEQRHARLKVQPAALAVDLERDGHLARAYNSPFAGEGFLETDRRQQAGRHGPEAEAFQETASRKAGGFGHIKFKFVRHGRLSFWKSFEPTAGKAQRSWLARIFSDVK